MTDAQAKAAAMTALHEFKLALQNNQDTADIETRYYDAIGDIDDDTLREPLENALMILNDADAARLAQEYAKIAARFKGVQAGFDLGAAVAGAGQKGLFFPAAAALLGQMEGIVTELADTAKTVRSGVDEIKAGVASAEAAIDARNVEGLIAAGETIKGKIDGLLETFAGLKQDLST